MFSKDNLRGPLSDSAIFGFPDPSFSPVVVLLGEDDEGNSAHIVLGQVLPIIINTRIMIGGIDRLIFSSTQINLLFSSRRRRSQIPRSPECYQECLTPSSLNRTTPR